MILQFDYEKIICDMEEFEADNQLTHNGFAKKSGIDVSIVSRIIHRHYRPGAKMVERLANAMGKTALDYSIVPVEAHNWSICDMGCNNMTVDQIDQQIAKLVKLRRKLIRSKLEEFETQKKEIEKCINEYDKKLQDEIELL